MSYIILNQKNYFHNLDLINKIIAKDNIIAVLKDNAYGHGLLQISDLAKKWGIRKVAVKNKDEAFNLQNKFEKIIILSPLKDEIRNDDFVYAINDFSLLRCLEKNTKIALKIDTGMHRNGILQEKLEDALRLILDKHLILCDVFSHFYAPKTDSFYKQKKEFLQAQKTIKQYFKNQKIRFHIHASGGFLTESKNLTNSCFFDENPDFDVRIGLLQYGYGDGFLNVLKLYAQKLSSRILKKGETIGYNAEFKAKQDMKVACYDIGYGDGLFRFNGQGEFKLLNGIEILGTMSMDSFSALDSGDEICVLDDARVFSKKFNTIEYEILTKLSKDIKRLIK